MTHLSVRDLTPDRNAWIVDGIMSKNVQMKYIENEGALLRGLARGWPEEVWSARERKFLPYKGTVPKGVEWGEFISDEEAQAIMNFEP